MTADPYLTCANCTHDKRDHEVVFNTLGVKTYRCNFLGCICREFQTIRRRFVDERDPVKQRIVRRFLD